VGVCVCVYVCVCMKRRRVHAPDKKTLIRTHTHTHAHACHISFCLPPFLCLSVSRARSRGMQGRTVDADRPLNIAFILSVGQNIQEGTFATARGTHDRAQRAGLPPRPPPTPLPTALHMCSCTHKKTRPHTLAPSYRDIGAKVWGAQTERNRKRLTHVRTHMDTYTHIQE
jgi:hypothetical protein